MEPIIDRRGRRVNNALTKNRSIWIATGVIVALGVLFIVVALGRTNRQRAMTVDQADPGQPASGVTSALGIQPVVCPPRPLDHLRESFPEGWAPAAVDVALEQLAAETMERWVYPMRAGRQVQCSGDGARTEVGVSPDSSIVWVIAVVGRTTVRLPPTYSPSGL